MRLDGVARTAWLDSYADHLITRDARDTAGIRDPDALRRYLEALAVDSACVVSEQTLATAAGINWRTAASYEQLLKNLMILEAVPAWMSTRLSRLVKAPKRYIVDPSVIGGLLKLDTAAVMRDGTLLDRLIETFALAQIRADVRLGLPRSDVPPARQGWPP